MYIFTHKHYFLLILLSAIFSGCGGGSSAYSSVQTEPQYRAVQQGQVRDITTEVALENVKVSINNISTFTDKNGYYTLSNLPENKNVTINFEKNGYLLGSTQIKLQYIDEDTSTVTNYLEYTMYTHDKQWNHDTTEELMHKSIHANASIYKDSKGEVFDGVAAINLTILDYTHNTYLNSFPGSFEGLNSDGDMVSFISYGLISIALLDNNHNELSLQDGETATLVFNIDASLKEEITLPLWYYNYEKGLWIEEGYAQLQENGTYTGNVAQFGTWSLNKPIENAPGIYRGHIIDENGLPISNVRLFAKGKNWIKSDLSTDQNGYFEIKVIPDSDFSLYAYNYKDKYAAKYNDIIPAIISGKIVED